MDQEILSKLQKAIAALEPCGGAPAAARFRLGVPALDAALGGGLSRGGLHEIYANRAQSGAAAAAGFGLGLALRAAGVRPLVWARHDIAENETGALYGDGLAALGLDPERLFVVRAANPTDALRAASEAVRCPAVGAAMVEIWGEPKVLDLKANQRLTLAARGSGVTLVMIRLGADPAPSAAASRWNVAAAASAALEANAPGRPAFLATLLRCRGGTAAGSVWRLEWDRDVTSFREAASLSRPLVSVPAGRPAAADDDVSWRRAG